VIPQSPELARFEDGGSLSRYTPKPVIMGREEWISVLKLSTLWTFRELRQVVDELLQIKIDPVDKVMLAWDYRVEVWPMEGYTELIKQQGSLSLEEEKRLGHKTTVQLYEKREKALTCMLQQIGYANNMSFNGLDTEIHETFWEEVIDIRYNGNAIQAASGSDGIGKDQSELEREIPPKKSKKGEKVKE
jgi:hypothetical protein